MQLIRIEPRSQNIRYKIHIITNFQIAIKLKTEVKLLPNEEFLEQYRATMVDVIMTGNKKKFYKYHPKQNDISEDP